MCKHLFKKPGLILWLALLPPITAHAEESDREQPIELEADTVTVNDAKKISIYTGNVILNQGTLQIKADKMIVREDQDGFQHSTCTGNPTTFKQKRTGKDEWMQGSAQRIEYNGRMDKVQLYTKAWVKRGEDIVNGDYISYDANAEYAEVIGGTKANPNGTVNSRVKATIQPKSKNTPPVIDNKPASQQGLKMNRALQFKIEAAPADTETKP
ncbi:lipopolysaccharide transport periplasmic protein LptA [Methylophilus aquaticus]|uniref:Lipopolysaccharide export system protein LptA n=2 Tax=Methylophilus aquaticus TaxID=1971610 RepID=A0ABT9JPK4_9PROT|nr:lipopolysaccharide transport periplasmic protein LptA [Methylophilus aquaticus]MDP8566488.1 lipopolysaccharide transport periplasmic protein LptA [Methylophilus aquaticus]